MRRIQADEDALRHLAKLSDGDARKTLNSLEIAALTTAPEKDGVIHITLSVAEQSIQKRKRSSMTMKTRIMIRFPLLSNPCAAAIHSAALYWIGRNGSRSERSRFINGEL